jgi:bifunctional UDP-N-acetylglucosamine pyrophosphorylase/glucosamine-1-phosphate N-acetyltransferase
MSTKLSVVILAAGNGTRMVSQKPKVLHELAGQSMLEHVYHTAKQLNPEQMFVIYGHQGHTLRKKLNHLQVDWVKQRQLLGTGHAVLQAIKHIPNDHQVLVLYGDVPLIEARTLSDLLDHMANEGIAVLTSHFDSPQGFGRILRDHAHNINGIVEHNDATPEQKAIAEVNTGILAANASVLNHYLPNIQANNQKQEYYLTDIIQMAYLDGVALTSRTAEPLEVSGVNNRAQLAQLERMFQRHQADQLLAQGVQLADRDRLDIRGQIQCGMDTFLDVNTVLVGHVQIGNNVYIGPNCYIKDAFIDDNAVIKANTVLNNVTVGSHCHVGPFSHIRPGSQLHANSHIGNFVEVKESTIGQYSKANHLAYLGDTTVENEVNIGAGTITCNYDGKQKYVTWIQQGAFIGSNTALVAPVTIGRNATVGAGSTITQDVAEGALGVARQRQRNVNGWRQSEESNELVAQKKV